MNTNRYNLRLLTNMSLPSGNLAFRQEVENYLKHYPATEHVDIFLNDLNGCIRGKRISVSELSSLEKGCYFPLSVYAMDLDGHVIEESGLGQSLGDPDRLCVPVSGALKPCAKDPEHHAQVLLTMKNPDGTPCEIEPRVVLERVLHRLHSRGLFPVVAAEVEFYLREQDLSGSHEEVLNTPSHCLSVDAPEAHSGLLNDIELHAKIQKIPLTGIVAEASAGQYELNLRHTDNVLEACDHVQTLKRLIRQVAEKHHQTATFMAKPYASSSGSGLHFHISLQDAMGCNKLASEFGELSLHMKKALAGMLSLMPASIAILAPNVNSYRRFGPGMHVPLHASWGYNNRSVALRLPCADRDNQRIEYRIAGADANPYLVMATILSGILHGLDNDFPLTSPEEGHNSAHQHAAAFPLSQQSALDLFNENIPLKELLGAKFCDVWSICRRENIKEFEKHITEKELEWHL